MATSEVLHQPESHRARFETVVASNTRVCREHWRFVLSVAGSFPPTEPGQFVQVGCADESFLVDPAGVEREIDWGAASDDEPRWETAPGEADSTGFLAAHAFLRRPFSLAGRTDHRDANGRVIGTDLTFIQRVVGVGTNWLSQLRPGDRVSILGPLGNRFSMPAPGQTALLVGGGVGIPPMLYLAEKLAGRSAVAFCGAVSADLLPLTLTVPADASVPGRCVAEFARHEVPTILSTDDGSIGYRGFVTQALERYIDSQPGIAFIIYTCGPEPMMKRVAEIGLSRKIPVQVAVERAMACGMGTCQSCCIRARSGYAAPDDWVYKLACTDGPVFDAADLLW